MRAIPNYPHYYASAEGRIWSDRSGLPLAVPPFVASGYLSVTVRAASGRRIAWVHQLVLMAYLGVDDAPVFHGKMGIRDNSTTNLRVSKSPRAITVATIAAVFDALAEGCTITEAARVGGVSIRTVSRIRARFVAKRNAQRNDPRAV